MNGPRRVPWLHGGAVALVCLLVACGPAAPAAPTAAPPKPTTAAAAAPTSAPAAAAKPAATVAPAKPPAPTAAPAAATTGEPIRGGSITVVHSNNPRSLNPRMDGGIDGNFIMTHVRERFLGINEKGDIVPVLATELPQRPDPLTYIFKLRQGVQFHDGSPFTADDAQYSFDIFLDEKTAFSGNFRKFIRNTEVVDPYTFRINMKSPWPDFLSDMANNSSLGILPKGALEKYGDDYGVKVVQGTGPFMFKEWVKDDRLVLVRNPNYWQKGLPYLDQIIFKPIPEESVQVINLRTGAADVLLDVPFKEAKALESEPGIRVLTHGAGVLEELMYNTLVPPFNDTKVRQGVALAINRQEIADTVFLGYAEVPTDLLPSWHWGHDPSSKAPEYNPEKARQLLTEAGYGPGKPLKFEIRCTNQPMFVDQAILIQAQLAKLGIEVTVTPMDKTLFFAPMFREAGADPKSWQAGLEDYGFTTATFSFVWEQYSADSTINTANYNMPGGFQNPEAAKLIEQAAIETDETKAKAIFKQEYAMLEADMPLTRLSFLQNVQAVRSRVKNISALVGDNYPFMYAWVDNN
jgi:ABC-type transport system substrate-binding protein